MFFHLVFIVSFFQILHLPYAQQEENIPGPLGHVQATGFGNIFFGSNITMGCIPVRRIQENECADIINKNDLESNKDIYRVAAKKAVPYRLELCLVFFFLMLDLLYRALGFLQATLPGSFLG